MMLERYLEAVGKYLPKARRDDILAELRANLAAQMEDREESLGRSLSEDEQAEILKAHGNPTFVAGRYREPNLGFAFGIQLIGPELFPIYRAVLAMILGISLCVLLAVMFILSRTTHETFTLARVLTPLPIQFVVTTLIFCLLERGKNHVLNRWDPRELPSPKPPDEEGPTTKNIIAFLFQAVGTLWLALTPKWPYLMLGPGALYLPAIPLTLMPQWPQFYRAILALMCMHLVLALFRLVRWVPVRAGRMANLALQAAGLVVGIALLLKYPGYFNSPRADVAEWANRTFLICVVVMLLINLMEAGKLFLSLLRERHQMLPARQY